MLGFPGKSLPHCLQMVYEVFLLTEYLTRQSSLKFSPEWFFFFLFAAPSVLNVKWVTGNLPNAIPFANETEGVLHRLPGLPP